MRGLTDEVSGILRLPHEASVAAHIAFSGAGVASKQEDR
jgi:hypothetical protein